jgi:hypothetical protein
VPLSHGLPVVPTKYFDWLSSWKSARLAVGGRKVAAESCHAKATRLRKAKENFTLEQS